MKSHTVWWVAALAFAIFTVNKAEAVEALSTEELVSHCVVYEDDPDGEDGIFCVRYIQGFIDGAVATDERVTNNVSAEYEKEESFTQRAIRTRVGSMLNRYGPSYYAEFCLGDPVPLADVVEVVVADLLALDSFEGRERARDVVYSTLRREYPCESDDE